MKQLQQYQHVLVVLTAVLQHCNQREHRIVNSLLSVVFMNNEPPKEYEFFLATNPNANLVSERYDLPSEHSSNLLYVVSFPSTPEKSFLLSEKKKSLLPTWSNVFYQG